MNHDWTDDIRDKLANYTEEPPTIDPALLRSQMVHAAHTARMKTTLAWGRRLVAAAAIAAIALPPAMTLLTRQGDTTPPTAGRGADMVKTATTARPDKAQPTTGQNTTAGQAEPKPLMAMAGTGRRPAPAQEGRAQAEPAETNAAAPTPTDGTAQVATPQQETQQHDKRQQHAARQPQPYGLTQEHGLTPRRQRLRAALAMGSSTTTTGATTALPALLAKADPIGWHAAQFRGDNSLPTLAQDNPTTTSVSHNQPITASASLNYRINDRWSVSAGLSYSYLRSELTAIGDNYAAQTTRRLHYVGVPIAASYTFWANKHFGVYATAGGMVEKMVSGRDETSTIVDGAEQSTTRDNVTIKPLQLSANAAIGAEWRFAPRLAIYAEPGISYHFDNGSNVTSFYSDNPLAFSLNVGLRFDVNK